MVTSPYFLDLDPFRSPKSKSELVQFHFPYLNSKCVQFQIRSSSKILQKSSESISIGEILQAFLLDFSTLQNWETWSVDQKTLFLLETLRSPRILSIANTSRKRSSISDKRDFGKEIQKGEVCSYKLELNLFFS